MRQRPPYDERYADYATPFDNFRRRERLDPSVWAKNAGASRAQLNRYRAGAELTTVTLARLVKAATDLLERQVAAFEIVGDLGEQTQLTVPPVTPRPLTRGVRKRRNTPLDLLLVQHKWPIEAFALEAQMSRQQLGNLRRRGSMSIDTLRRLVITFRRLGIDVKASDIADVGEHSYAKTTT